MTDVETLNDRSQITRAARVENFGPSEALEIVEVPIPVPGAGQVMVRNVT
jgi:NADPH:quinone reductase-like Zn-dependent oxidoreductase